VDDSQFYATAAQVIPTIWVVLVLELGAMRLRIRLESEARRLRAKRRWWLSRQIWLGWEVPWVFPRPVWFLLMFLTAVAVPGTGELAAVDALMSGESTALRRNLVFFAVVTQVAFVIAIGLRAVERAAGMDRAHRATTSESQSIRATIEWIAPQDRNSARSR